MAVKVYSGVAPPPALLEAMAAEGKIRPKVKPSQKPHISTNEDIPPPTPQRPAPVPGPASNPAVAAQPDETYDEAPPSYEDAMAEGIGPVDGPRREYNPPNVSAATRPSGGPVTDVKTPVDSLRDNDSFYTHGRSSRESSESVDMLPTTPGSRPESMVETLLDEPGHTGQTQPASVEQYPQTVKHDPQQQPGAIQLNQPGPSRPDIRTFNTGVPNRRPVPGQRRASGA